MYKEIEITDRIKAVRKLYRTGPAATQRRPLYYSGDRWISLGFLEGWEKYETAFTTKLRRSLAEAYELDSAKPVIDDNELICGKPYFPDYEGEEKERFESLLSAFKMSPTSSRTEGARPRADHICLDFEKLLKVGIKGIIEEIKEKRRELAQLSPESLYDFDVIEKKEFYDCCIIELEAVVRLAKRYAEKAKEMAQAEKEPRRSELLAISDVLSNVPENPAKSFYEAVQSVHFYLFNMFGLYPLGRPDRYLYPFYEKDVKEGKLTREFAQELVDNLCLGVSGYVFPRAACGFIVGGTDKDGNLVENDLTYMFLTALHHIKMPDPNGALAVNEMTSKEILSYAADVIADGTTHPAIYNDKAIIQGLMSYGVDAHEACDYIHTTCAEISVCGKSRMYTTSITVSLPSMLLEIFEKNSPQSFEEIEELYFDRVEKFLSRANFDYMTRILEAKRNGYQPMRASCLVDDCIEKGTDVYSGGAKYSYMQPIFIGFATFCDSLFAIKKLVFDDKTITLDEFVDAVRKNYEGCEPLRQYIINRLPHYGNDNSEIDSFAYRLYEKIENLFGKKTVFAADFCMPGTFSYINHASRGAGTGATFDGRLSGMSFSDGCCPSQGLDRNGPTAMINSLTGFCQEKFMGGMVVNMKFSKSVFDDKKKDVFLGVIDTFIKRGGVELQVNCVDKSTLEDAVVHPENHGDLIVRIGGYSDYFVRLSDCMKKEVIARTQY